MQRQETGAPNGATPVEEPVRALLRHILATIAYRTARCLRDAPPGYAGFAAGRGARTPTELVFHLTGLVLFAQGLLVGTARRDLGETGFDEEIARLERVLIEADEAVASATAWHGDPLLALQGPLADALTHVGQLAMLRRLAGSPLAGENYARASIRAGELLLR